MTDNVDGFSYSVPIANRTHFLKRAKLAVWASILLVLISGCASVSVVDEPGEADSTPVTDRNSSPAWYFVRFRLARDDAGNVNSYLDPMLADQVLAPVIVRHAQAIPLWRFHRRWPDDQTGHQFSFIFYAPGDVATRVIGEIQQHALLRELRETGHLREHFVDAGSPTEITAASDRSWPETIQRHWPAFIAGASRMWLGLVQQEADLQEQADLHERFRAVEDRMEALWFAKGNHAFFHHLSALFGYKPMRVIRRDVMTF